MKRILPIAIASMLAFGGAWLLACGPWLTELQPALTRGPADTKAYDKGQLGIVRPNFALGYLLQAYRSLTPRPARANVTVPAAQSSADGTVPEPAEQWQTDSSQLLGTPRSLADPWRHIPGDTYQTFENCPDTAFASALRTFDARSLRFGARSAELREWVRAQVAVFNNCHDGPLVLPPAAPIGADVLIKADRAYQTAAAYFYATDYETAASRFEAIADDRTSPWRPFGRYLAARANIRFATLRGPNGQLVRDRLAVAEAHLQAVLADPSAAALHASARGLLGFTSARLHPVERLHELSKRLTAARAPDEQDVYDYRYIFNAMSDGGPSAPSRSDMVRGDDLTDWLLTMRGGEGATARAVERWRDDRTAHWLVAGLWQTDAPGADANDLLDAARLLDRQSPAFATVAFLRVRLLTAIGRTDDARGVLATLPDQPEPAFGAETINLFKAERLRLATSLDEFLINAPRAVVIPFSDPYHYANGRLRVRAQPHDQPVFDEDAASTLALHMPLSRLVDAALSPQLPPRLRLRVAMASLTRAMVLERESEGLRLLPVLRDLAPGIRADLDRYASAADAPERRRAGVLLLLHTPGATIDVRSYDDEYSFAVVEPAREFDHMFRRNWWCAVPERRFQGSNKSEVISVLYGGSPVPAPTFVTADEQTTADRELRTIVAAGSARDHLALAAIEYATANPGNSMWADALARVVEGWRWSCAYNGDADKSVPLPQRAFTTLHRLFPQSAAAQRTKYWYKN